MILFKTQASKDWPKVGHPNAATGAWATPGLVLTRRWMNAIDICQNFPLKLETHSHNRMRTSAGFGADLGILYLVEVLRRYPRNLKPIETCANPSDNLPGPREKCRAWKFSMRVRITRARWTGCNQGTIEDNRPQWPVVRSPELDPR